MKELTSRSLSGAVYVGLIILFTQYLPLSPLLVLFTVLGIPELFRLFDLPNEPSLKRLFFVGAIASLMPLTLLEFYLFDSDLFSFARPVIQKIQTEKVFAFIPFALIINLIYLLGRKNNQRGWALPFIYLVLPSILAIDFQLYKIQDLKINPVLVLFILLWSSDTFAYITGRLFGKNKIAPKISPGKTWEGAIGGTLITLTAAYVLHQNYLFDFIGITPFLIGVIVIVIAGIVGDLIESKLKRKKGIKDSGNLMPGHGGILDRLDSFLLAMPIAYIYFGLIL
jgi:phosphatidate cytidylyltransferase